MEQTPTLSDLQREDIFNKYTEMEKFFLSVKADLEAKKLYEDISFQIDDVH
jgi:hypothetical protein